MDDTVPDDNLLSDDLLENDLIDNKSGNDSLTESIVDKETPLQTKNVILITEFMELDEDVQYRNVETWTGMEALNLPDKLEAMASFSDEEPEQIVINGISWKLSDDNGELDGGEEEINGSFTFTAVLPEHYSIVSGGDAPEIYVQVGNAERQLFAVSDYYENDLTAFRALLNAHPSLQEGLKPDDPSTWAGTTGYNGIVKWDFSGKRIDSLDLNKKQLNGTLDISGFDYLSSLDCSNNNLTNLTVDCARLNTISCSNNSLTDLSISGTYGLLKRLYCSSNQLTSLNMAGYNQLEYLNCSKNKLTSLTLNSALTELDCSENDLSTLSLNAKMKNLYCSSNNLTVLNTSALNLTRLNCSDNNLSELNLTNSTSLITLDCSNNNISRLTMPNKITVTLNSSENGTSQITRAGESNSQWIVFFKADPNENYKLSYWNCSGSTLTEQEKISNPLFFAPASNTTISAVFTEDHTFQDAKDKIESQAPYTVSQSSANTQDTVKTWLAGQINGIAGMSDTGITVTSDNINISSFTPAMSGNADNANGTNGSFTFTVTLTNNGSTETTKSINGVITATAFSGQTNAQIVAAAKSAVESGNYLIDQATSNTQDGIIGILVNKINSLTALSSSGISVAAGDITVTNFTAAKNGDADTPDGVDGSFSFTVSLKKGESSVTTNRISGTITAADFAGQTNAQVIAAAKAAIEGGNYLVDQADANTQDEIKGILINKINSLAALSSSGILVADSDITFAGFTAAKNGDADTPAGVNGSFSFTVSLKKGTAQTVTANITGTITAKQYVPSETPDDNKPDNKPDNNKPEDNNPDDGKPDDNKPDTNKPDTNKPDNSNPTPDNSGSNGSSGNNGSSNNNNSYNSDDSDSNGYYYDTPSLTAESTPVTAEIIVGQPDNTGNITITAIQIKDALNAARREARQKKTLSSGVTVTVRLPEGITQASIDSDGLNHLSAADVTSVCFDYKGVSFTLYQDTLTAMSGLAADSVVFAVKPISGLTGKALTAINTHPVYELSAAYKKNGIPMPLTTVGSINVAIAYTPSASEDISALHTVSVDGLGNAHRIPDSKYNPANSAVCFTINNFSTFGISNLK
ncbi:hypothetical protein [Clostridium sp. chh4-2]|uniref:InlB B-repeat-containing protein n=1 Tax=Clostridium sp. chh4-2 TaxID=2067550 RepID=UPI0015E179D4|nr:hypothetical protein [Clostridium sp. chh4-2]